MINMRFVGGNLTLEDMHEHLFKGNTEILKRVLDESGAEIEEDGLYCVYEYSDDNDPEFGEINIIKQIKELKLTTSKGENDDN